jgi:HK97 family phage prohead protease
MSEMKNKKQLQIRAFALNEKSKFDDESLKITGVVISSAKEDSFGTTFNPDGVDKKRFEKNPVLLLNHNDYNGLPIGRVENIRQDGDALLADVVFEDVTKEAKGRDIYNLLKGGFLNGFSIRFHVLRFGNEKQGECTFEEWELLEVSVVNIPANPEAVVKRSAETKEPKSETESEVNEELTPTDEVQIADVRAIVCEALAQLKKVDDEKQRDSEAKEQFITDLRAALKNSYKTIGKTLRSIKENAKQKGHND